MIPLKGFQGNGTECSDIDECTDGTHNCATDATCENNHGGYDCKCNQGSRTKHDFDLKHIALNIQIRFKSCDSGVSDSRIDW